jgi:hypothetical protein
LDGLALPAVSSDFIIELHLANRPAAADGLWQRKLISAAVASALVLPERCQADGQPARERAIAESQTCMSASASRCNWWMAAARSAREVVFPRRCRVAKQIKADTTVPDVDETRGLS